MFYKGICYVAGRRRWKYRTLAQLFGGLEADLLGFLPDFDYIFTRKLLAFKGG